MASASPFRIGPRRVPPLLGSLAAYSLTRVIRSSAHNREAAPNAGGLMLALSGMRSPGLRERRGERGQITLSAGAGSAALAIDSLSPGFQGKFARRFITYQSSSAGVKSKSLVGLFVSFLFYHHPYRNSHTIRARLLTPPEAGRQTIVSCF